MELGDDDDGNVCSVSDKNVPRNKRRGCVACVLHAVEEHRMCSLSIEEVNRTMPEVVTFVRYHRVCSLTIECVLLL